MSSKEVKQLLRALEREGAVISLANCGHWKITNPVNGRSIQIAATPGDTRWIKNASTRLRRIGLVHRGIAQSATQVDVLCR